MHSRQLIRESVGVMLTGLTTTGSRVHQSRVYDIESGKAPALIIYTTAESSERDSYESTGDGLERTLALVIEGYAKGKDIDDTLDDIAEEVEVAIAADNTLGGFANNCFLESTEMDLTGQGNSIAGVVTLTYEIRYRTTRALPGTPIY